MDVGIFDVTLNYVMISYATADFPARGLSEGLHFAANIQFLGMLSNATFSLSPLGTNITLSFVGNDVTQVGVYVSVNHSCLYVCCVCVCVCACVCVTRSVGRVEGWVVDKFGQVEKFGQLLSTWRSGLFLAGRIHTNP